MTDLPALPKVPFKQARELWSGALPHYDDSSQFDGIGPEVGAMFNLAPGAVFVSAAAPHPFAFVASLGSRRTHIVVGREYGDLAWPAFVKRQRMSVTADVQRIVRKHLGDVTEWIAESQARLDALAAEDRVHEQLQDDDAQEDFHGRW